MLEAVRWRRNGTHRRRPIRHVFNFIGDVRVRLDQAGRSGGEGAQAVAALHAYLADAGA